MKIALAALPALFSLALSLPAQAQTQTQTYVGQWGCQFAYTEFDQFGNRTSGHMQEFMMAVYDNNTYQASGNTLGPAGAVPFQSQGQWSDAQGFFNAQGQMVEQSMFGSMPMMFMVIATLDPGGGMMRSTNETPDPSNSYLMARANTACQKQG